MMADYYRQRAGAGLILSEGIPVAADGVGYAGTGGLWTEAQTQSWRQVTDAVHATGGQIIAQLWHVGRLSDPAFLDGALPIAPSAVAAAGTVTRLRPKKSWEQPQEMNQADITRTIEAFATAARNARTAGFDGIDIHGANGYLIDQFLQAGSNFRTDVYGGSVANRMRFLQEILDAVIPIWGADRVALHLSPRDGFSMSDPDAPGLFTEVARAMGQRGLAFLYVREEQREDAIGPAMREAFGGAMVMNSGLSAHSAAAILAAGRADAVGFGRMFISNPDLPTRLAAGVPLTAPDPATFYDGGAHGYIDYALSSIPE
jgi:2,4-dienoyl-CoA reductase-like NADH-dependent reductase (Old Yellow Enzyme family)